MADKTKPQVGQLLYKCRYDEQVGEIVVVVSVGRKWVTVCPPGSEGEKYSHVRFDYNDPRSFVDSTFSHTSRQFRIWPNQKARDDEWERDTLWRSLRRVYEYSLPSHVSLEDMREVARLLGLDPTRFGVCDRSSRRIFDLLKEQEQLKTDKQKP